jgi:hypothetical protein
LRATGRVPSTISAGAHTYRLAVRDSATREILSGLTQTIGIVVEAPLPEPVTPTEVGIQPGQVRVLPPDAQPLRPAHEQTVTLSFIITNLSGLGAPVEITAFPRDQSGRTRGTLRTTRTLNATGNTSVSLRWNVPDDALSGPYSVQLFVWDPRTFVAGQPDTYLWRQTYQSVFRVR